jgi:hypothetical protein
LNNAPVRIISIEEDDEGVLHLVAEEFPGGTATSVLYPVEVNQGAALDHNIIPSAVNPPVIFEPPAALTDEQRQVWIAISGGTASAYRLTEDSSAGTHLILKTLASRPVGTLVSFSVFVQPGERSACRIEIHDGSEAQGADFDLSTGTFSEVSPGVTGVSIDEITGSTWYLLSISCPMASTSAPRVSISLQNPLGSSSYTGTGDAGLYIWGPKFAADAEVVHLIPATMSTLQVNFVPDGVAPPPGVEASADPYWGGCIIYVSTENATYGQIGQVKGPSRQGILTADLPLYSGQNPDSANTLKVDLSASAGELTSVSNLDAVNGVTLSLVGDELLAFETATLSDRNAYNLTGLTRGLYGTSAAAHSAGTNFVRLDDTIFKYVIPESYIGRTLYLKFQSFNIFGQALQDLSSCAVYTYVPNGSGAGMMPIAAALSIGTSLDYGGGSEAVTQAEDFGLASDSRVTVIDLGLASA